MQWLVTSSTKRGLILAFTRPAQTMKVVDAEIILAGLEPAIERGAGPGLRESVLAAIWARTR